MAGALRKMGVYLGLVEDVGYTDSDLDEFEDETQYDSRNQGTRQSDQKLSHSSRGSAGSYQRLNPATPSARPQRSAVVSSGVRTIRPGTQSRVSPPASTRSLDFSRIETVHPRSYNDARRIGEEYRQGIPVIMNLTELADSDAKRIVDFAAGLVFGQHGVIERITSKVFLLSPANVDVRAAAQAQLAEDDFFNQS